MNLNADNIMQFKENSKQILANIHFSGFEPTNLLHPQIYKIFMKTI